MEKYNQRKFTLLLPLKLKHLRIRRTMFESVDICADLQREEDDSEADDCSDAHSYDDRLGVVEAGDHAHHIGEAQRQNGL